MKVLVIGAAGYVGTILRPALEQACDVRYPDRRTIAGAQERTYVGDVEDEVLLRLALSWTPPRDVPCAGQQEAMVLRQARLQKMKAPPVFSSVDSVLYMALARGPAGEFDNVDANFNIHVRALYRTVRACLHAGVRQIIYASSLSVFHKLRNQTTDENRLPDAADPYGISKLLGEHVCQQLSIHFPQACIMSLRLMLPRQEKDYARFAYHFGSDNNSCALAPNDTRRLFLSALQFRQGGYHMVQASGDLEDKLRPNHMVRRLLGWSPKGD